MHTILNVIYNLSWLSLLIYYFVRWSTSRKHVYSHVISDETTIFSNECIFIKTIRFTDLFFTLFGCVVSAIVLLASFGIIQITGMLVFYVVMNSIIVSIVSAESLNSRIMDESEYIQKKTGLFVKYY